MAPVPNEQFIFSCIEHSTAGTVSSSNLRLIAFAHNVQVNWHEVEAECDIPSPAAACVYCGFLETLKLMWRRRMRYTRLKEKFGTVGAQTARATPTKADTPVQDSDATPVKPKKTPIAKSGNKKRKMADEDTEESGAVKEEPNHELGARLQCKGIEANRANR